MERTIATLLSFVIGVGLISLAEASCKCMVDHPQTRFCHADFALVGTVIGGVVTDDNYFRYSVEVIQIFKGDWLVQEGLQIIDTPYYGSLCGRPNLGLETYFISGSIVGDKMQMSYCNWVAEWDDVTPDQKHFLRTGIYEENCGCPITGMVSKYKVNYNKKDGMAHPSQISGLWTHFQCKFNPVASAEYGRKDCETDSSFCARNDEGVCEWRRLSNYELCFADRERFWEMDNVAAAYTSRSQCREIQNKKLKRRCLRLIRNHRKRQRNEEADTFQIADGAPQPPVNPFADLGLDLDIFDEQN